MAVDSALSARRSHRSRPGVTPLARAIALSLALAATPVLAQQANENTTENADEQDPSTLDTVRVTAEQIARQALGTSIITAEDLERRPPVNDLADIIRTMPGVNLTGNSASGQYGNNRQIDLRGMGPENTLILIDGKPVGSRDSVRMGRSGERNTRGDTNWVPAEAVERIEVLRGPAAARYGSGASGGVINIITKKPGKETHGSVTMYAMTPHHDEEGDSRRIGFNLSGPLAENWAYRVYGNASKTDADSLALNADYATGVTPPAGREGVRNRDINGLVRWDPVEGQVFEFEAGFSRQGNIYAGDRAVSGAGTDLLTELAERGAETNIMFRRNGAITHRGSWEWGSSRLSLSHESTDNKRLNEGLAGGPEGSINTEAVFSTSSLKNTTLDGEVNIPVDRWGVPQVFTLGFEHRDNRLDDPFSVSQGSSSGGGIPGLPDGTRSGKADAQTSALFAEDNIYLTERLTLTPGLRFDHHSQFGNNLSPSLNAQYQLGGDFMLKGGVARAFKAPNLYQSNGNYLYYTMGNGCPVDFPSPGQGCYIRGNPDLDPETSLNKEIGVEWAPESGYQASLTYFHNDYEDKITTSLVPIGQTQGGTAWVFLWENAPEAIVQGFEGNFNMPLIGDRGSVLKWSNNITYMIENENTSTGQPLSVIPKYTVNTALDWRPSEDWSFLLNGTFYGKQESATQSPTTGGPLLGDTRGAYALWGVSGRYTFAPRMHVGFGINNLFDKRLFREATNNTGGGAGAATYNEAGRSYFVTLGLGF